MAFRHRNVTFWEFGSSLLLPGLRDEQLLFFLGSLQANFNGFLFIGSLFFFRLAERAAQTASNKITEGIKRVALYSFGFYLIHPFLLKEAARFIPMHNNYLFHIDIFLRYITVIVFCYLVIFTIHKLSPKTARLLFGKMPPEAVFVLSPYRNNSK